MFYLLLPVIPGVSTICEAVLHGKKQAVNRYLVCSLHRQMLFTPDKMLSYSKGKMELLLNTLQISLRTASKWALCKARKYHLLILVLSRLAFFTTQNILKNWKQPPNPAANSYSWAFVGRNPEATGSMFGFIQTSYKMLVKRVKSEFLQTTASYGIPFSSSSCFRKCAAFSEALRTLICKWGP